MYKEPKVDKHFDRRRKSILFWQSMDTIVPAIILAFCVVTFSTM